MRFIPVKTLMLCMLFCITSCAFHPAIDEQGNVTIRKPNAMMRSHGVREFKHLKRSKPTSRDPRYTERVQRVAKRLCEVIDIPEAEWEFVIFRDASPNAFCLPGGKVGINTGLFHIIGQDDALLAAVLGHEISHVTSNHAEQRMYRALLLSIGAAVLWTSMDNQDIDNPEWGLAGYALSAYIFDSLPLSRKQEHESDKIGAIFMAKAGYDPRKSVELWRILKNYHHHSGGQKPEFLRTHPLDEERIKALEEFMPIAMQHYRKALRTKSAKH